MLNLNDVHLFVQAVDRNGFTAAARALGIPKSTMSKRIAALEEALGVTLVHRNSRRFALTDVGREFHRHASAMIVEAEAAERVVKGRLAEPSGLVRITCSIPTARRWMGELLPEIANRYPALRVSLHATDRFVDLAYEGFDLAIRSHFGDLPDSDLVQRRVAVDPFWIVASPDYLARRGTPAHPSELAAHDALLVDPARPQWRLEGPRGATLEVRPVARMFADDSLVLSRAAAGGLGITVLPSQLCRAEIESGTLMRVLPAWTAGKVTTTILTPSRRAMLPAVRAVSDFLATRMAERA
ncbi:LysR substrate-binding domain-containing protein [Sandaracinus amylolyticus]|uniref:Transcriptional regulator, LysR family protein n=1 Tax=Sandaracinus amylolyticus TaxID=927083 RepID=A0A0F6W1I4_9BACT|nr:LysR substrate-binding domain-containing protein [Sandaracinus amylolyticus]AKF05055.1 Transcriptional regulator, LysR family protein [Sandaracinus amylolyticus]